MSSPELFISYASEDSRQGSRTSRNYRQPQSQDLSKKMHRPGTSGMTMWLPLSIGEERPQFRNFIFEGIDHPFELIDLSNDPIV